MEDRKLHAISDLEEALFERIEALTAEVDRLKQEVHQFRRVNDGLQDAMLAAEAERDRLWGALNDLVTFLEGTGFTTRFCDAARAALKGQQP